MKRAAFILAALAAILTAAAAPVRTATENFVTTKIAEAVAAIPAPDYSTNNTALVETIQAKAPAASVNGKAGEVSLSASDVGALGNAGDQTLSGSLIIDKDAPDGDAWLQTKRGEQNGLAIWFSGFRIDGYFQALPYANGTLALLPDIYAAVQQIAPVFTRKEYVLDELCTYNGVVYRCKRAYTVDISNPTPDRGTTHWEAKKVSELFARLSDIPDVPAWALEAQKPTYTASEVGATTPEDVTAAIREQSLGGIWDETLQVWWTPRMRNGSLTYEATTNVNLNAEN